MKQFFKPSPAMLAVLSLLGAAQAGGVYAQVGGLRDTMQMSPSGYTGAINTPTADVLPMGSATLALTNSIPEQVQRFPGSGGFGGLNLGFGLFPGLELVGRLSFDGDLQCNLFNKPACKGGTRDLSVGAKYQLPFVLPQNTRMAVGFTDYGGAATNYRQVYGVATSTLGPMDVSLGYSKGSSRTPLMDGVFGSAMLRLTDRLAVAAEHDTKAKRLGVHYTQPLSPQVDVQLGFSRKLRGPASQQTHQVTAALHYYFDKDSRDRRKRFNPAWDVEGGVTAGATSGAVGSVLAQALTPEARAHDLAQRLAANGFANIGIAFVPASAEQAALWWIRAEPVGWRKNRQYALASALVQWMHGKETAAGSEVLVSLSYMGVPSGGVYTSRDCLNRFATGANQCGQGQALTFFNGKDLPARLQSGAAPVELVRAAQPMGWKPQFEVGANIRSTIGTEYGLADYSAALDLGAQMQLGEIGPLGEWGRGWMWQGNVLVPVARSEDFDKGGVYHGLGHTEVEVDQALLSYVGTVDTPLAKNVAVQASVGAINSYNRGAQLDAVWMNQMGDWRVGGTLGAYSRNKASGVRSNQSPALLSVRRSVLAGNWQLEGTVGKFLAGDSGFKAASHHWFGDYKLSFFVQESKGSTAAMPKRRFAGFQFSMPLGPKGGMDMGWGSVRGQDRMSWGVKTKVGETNNALTTGYGEVPVPRHGVWSDMSDFDRSGPVDMWANRHALRAALQTEKP